VHADPRRCSGGLCGWQGTSPPENQLCVQSVTLRQARPTERLFHWELPWYQPCCCYSGVRMLHADTLCLLCSLVPASLLHDRADKTSEPSHTLQSSQCWVQNRFPSVPFGMHICRTNTTFAGGTPKLAFLSPTQRQVWSWITCLYGETVLGREVLRSIVSLAAQAQSWALHINWHRLNKALTLCHRFTLRPADSDLSQRN